MINEGFTAHDGYQIICDIIYIPITLTIGSREPSGRANANKTQAFSRGVQTGLEFGRRLSFRGVKKRQEMVGYGVVIGGWGLRWRRIWRGIGSQISLGK